MTSRIARYAVGGDVHTGLVTGSTVQDLDLTLRDALVLSAAGCADRVAGSAVGVERPLDEVTLLAPVPDEARVFCVGINYLEHQRESADVFAASVPEHPIVFLKDRSALTSPGADLHLPAAVSEQFDWEVELGILIGAPARRLAPEEAWSVVAGCTVVNDITARDLQTKHTQWCLGKNVVAGTPVGPWITLTDGVEPEEMNLELTVNGAPKQKASTAELIFDVPTILSVISAVTPLRPGDLVATGTPSGVGFKRTPPEFLADGDVVTATIDTIGVLTNRVVTGAADEGGAS